MRISARFLLIFVFLASFFIFRSEQSFAAEKAQDPNPQVSNPLNTAPDVEKNLHNATQIIMLETMSGALCQLTGNDFLHRDQKCLGMDPKSGKIGYVGTGGGAIGAVGTFISYTLIPPASSIQYVAYLKNNFGVTKNAYAANSASPCQGNNDKGIGFCGLWPIVNLWLAMRNIVYLILILIFIVIGVAIMLRIHIDPRTVMTVQNQIPKIIVGIIAITFSFAIAGFLIDIMFVATNLFAAVITGAAGGRVDFNAVVLASNPFDAANSAVGGVGQVAGKSSDAFASLIKNTLTGTSDSFGGVPFLADIIKGIINILALLIISIAVLVALIRLWVTLILTYINIIIDVVFAPFWILAGIVPGSPFGVGSWIRDLIANLSVFPMTVGFFLLANVFITEFKDNTISRFVPPLLGGVGSETISALIGLGFILMLPTTLTTMKAALKAPKLDLGPILKPVGAGAGAVFGIPKRAVGSAERFQYASRGKGIREQALRFFGNPIYTNNTIGRAAEPPTLKPHEGPPGPGEAT